MIAAIPFALFPLRVADALFVGLAAALFGWVLTRDRMDSPQLFAFGSAAYPNAFHMSQWSPLLSAAALIPSLGFLLACKPTLGLPLFAAYPSRHAILSAGLITCASIAVWPW